MSKVHNPIQFENGEYRLTGELGFNTVPQIWKISETMFSAPKSELIIDLGAVTRTDSAGLALLIGWIRRGQANGISTKFKNIPEQLLAIAKVSGVEDMLPMGGE